MIEMFIKQTTLICITALSIACKSNTKQDYVDAIIINPTSESRTELIQFISSALNRKKVILADDALTEDSFLIIDHKLLNQKQHNAALGRINDIPVKFKLVTDGKNCILRKENGNLRQILKNTDCIPK